MREDLVLQACLEAYGLVRHEGRLADRALDFTLRRKTHLYSSERRAVAERVYALLRRQLTVDHLLAKTSKNFDRLTVSEKDLLRLSAARILNGDAAEAVLQSAQISGAKAAMLSGLSTSNLRLEGLSATEAFAISASVPIFLAERLLEELGSEANAFAAAMNERAPLTARVNLLKTSRDALMARLRTEEVDCRPTPLSPLGIFLETRINAFSLPSFKEGLFELQDEGSQLLGMIVDPPPTRIVDACAGAGGKTLQLAADMKNKGEIIALDIDERRLSELHRRARRDGVHNVRIRPIPLDGEAVRSTLADLESKADRVLVDAPCSGTGTFRRKPDARYRLSQTELAEHTERQRRLLVQFAPLVKPGGRLIYGTCSVLREENEDVIAQFLQLHSHFSVLPVEQALHASWMKPLTRDGFLRLFPHRHGTDGFFGAVLMRTKEPPG